MDEPACPRCKTTKYRNPSLKLLVNVCGHTLCENCVELLFVRGSGVCQECGIALRRANFRVQLFEDAGVEKEVDIRKKVLRDYNKKEEDFATLREYNDYLEMVETIVFNLTYGVDVEDTKRQIENYKRENHDFIRKNRSKLSKEEELLEALIEQEKEDIEIHRQTAIEEERKVQQERKKNKAALIDELMFSDLPADHILAVHKRELNAQQQEEKAAPSREKLTTFSSGIRVGKQENVFLPIPKAEEGKLFCYSPVHLENYGPLTPQDEDVGYMGYLKHIRTASDSEMGGGYSTSLGCQRALQEAFCGLFFSFDMVKNVAASSGLSIASESPEDMQTDADWG